MSYNKRKSSTVLGHATFHIEGGEGCAKQNSKNRPIGWCVPCAGTGCYCVHVPSTEHYS